MMRLGAFVMVVAIGCGVPLIPSASAQPAQIKWEDVPRLKPKCQFTLPADHYRVLDNSIQVSADGTRVAIAYAKTFDAFTQVWQISDKPKLIFESPRSPQGGKLALSPSGKRVFNDGKVYDVDTQKPIATVSDAFFYSCIFFKDEDTVVSTNRSWSTDYSKPHKGRITVWNVATNKDAGTFEVPDGRFVYAYPGNGGKEIWVLLPDKGEIACYDIAEKKLKRTIKPEPNDPKKPLKLTGVSLAVAPDELAFSMGLGLRVYDETGKPVSQKPREGGDLVVGGLQNGLIPGSRYLGEFYEKAPANKLALYDWKTGKGLAVLEGFASNRPDILAAASADGKTVVAVSKAGQVLVFDISTVK